jgi:hypothetical protein
MAKFQEHLQQRSDLFSNIVSEALSDRFQRISEVHLRHLLGEYLRKFKGKFEVRYEACEGLFNSQVFRASLRVV